MTAHHPVVIEGSSEPVKVYSLATTQYLNNILHPFRIEHLEKRSEVTWEESDTFLFYFFGRKFSQDKSRCTEKKGGQGEKRAALKGSERGEQTISPTKKGKERNTSWCG